VRATVPPTQRAHRILRKLGCFTASPRLPDGLALNIGDQLIGGIVSSSSTDPAALLSGTGAYLHIGAAWHFVQYGDISISFPEKSKRDAPLVLRTPIGSTALLEGNRELWEVGRYFLRCRGD